MCLQVKLPTSGPSVGRDAVGVKFMAHNNQRDKLKLYISVHLPGHYICLPKCEEEVWLLKGFMEPHHV